MTFCHFLFLKPNFLLSTCNSINVSYSLFCHFFGPPRGRQECRGSKEKDGCFEPVGGIINFQHNSRPELQVPPSNNTAKTSNLRESARAFADNIFSTQAYIIMACNCHNHIQQLAPPLGHKSRREAKHGNTITYRQSAKHFTHSSQRSHFHTERGSPPAKRTCLKSNGGNAFMPLSTMRFIQSEK